MALSNLLSRAEDLEREAGRILAKLSSEMPADLTQEDYNNLRDSGKDLAEDLDTLRQDAEDEYEDLTVSAQEGRTGGRYQEFIGEVEEAQTRLDDANDLLRQLCTGAGVRSNASIGEVVMALEAVSDILTRAAGV